MDKFSFLEQYAGIDPKAVAENYDRANKLYEGDWVQYGDYPEEGDFRTNNKDRDRAIEMFRKLYHYLEPYNQQIREDYQKYRQMDWLEKHNLPYGEGEILERLYWVCEFYDTKIKFTDELRDGQQPQQTPAVVEPQQALEYYCKKAVANGYLEECGDGKYKRTHCWSKALLAYFLEHFLENGRLPETKYNLMFNESRLGKALTQTKNNKHGDGKPRGFENVDKLLQ